MKTTILTFAILVTAFGFAKGQPITANSFNAAIANLSTAIQSKNTANMNGNMDKLNGLMGQQLAYMRTYVNGLKTKYTADSTTVANLKRAAAAEAAAAQAEVAKGNQTQANVDQAKAYQDQKDATKMDATVRAEKTNIETQTANWQTQIQAYNQIQPLRSNVLANQNGIISNLDTFSNLIKPAVVVATL